MTSNRPVSETVERARENLLQVRQFLLDEYSSGQAEAEGYPVDREARPAWNCLHAALEDLESTGK